jgi:Ca2+-binding RTX toxin-like protein
VFVSDRTAKGNRELFRMRANGTSPRRLLAHPCLWDMSPDRGSSRGRRGCTITGTINADDLVGTPHPDVICGLGGNDRLRGLGGNDVLVGGAGADVLDGGPGRDAAAVAGKGDRLRGVERRVQG